MAGTAPYAGEPGQAAVSHPEPYLSVDTISALTGWIDGSDTISESFSVLPGWALADDTGIQEKFEPGLYQKIQNLVASQLRQESVTRSAVPPTYYDIVILVTTHDADGNDISKTSKKAVADLLTEAGARNVSAAQTLSFVTASVPVAAINSVSLYGEVFLIGDGQRELVHAMSSARQTVNATGASLGRTNGTGVTVAVLDDGINHPSLNDKTTHVKCTPLCTVVTDLAGINSSNNGVTHGTLVAHVAAGSEGIAPGASLLDINSFYGGNLAFYHALDWAINHGADAVNYSIVHLQSKKSTCNLSTLISHHVANDAINRGMFIVGVAGNAAVINGTTTYKSVQNPGCATGVLTVGGIDDRRDDLRMYNGSGRGPVFDDNAINANAPLLKPEIVAPAVKLVIPQAPAPPRGPRDMEIVAPAVKLVIPAYSVVENDRQSAVISGTSFAAPMVTGAAAVLLEEDGELDARELRAALLVGADWKGPVPCTSVQFEAIDASDNCSHARQPTDQNEANGPESLGILNNVGFGVLNVGQSLDYVRNGQHIVSGSLGAGHDRTYFLKVDDLDKPLKVILSWNSPTEVVFNDNRTSFTGASVTFLDTGMKVACPGMDTVVADSVHQVNEFAVFTPARAGTCTVTVTDVNYAAGYALASTGSFVDEGAFVTTWRTATAGETITIPLVGTGITVDWGDGNISTGVSVFEPHTYADAGDHTVTMTGGLERIALNNTASASNLVSIDQWGNIGWTSMASAFRGAANMGYAATDSPDLSGVADMSRMFEDARRFNGDISSWNVSSVTDMTQMFNGATSFHQNLGNWYVVANATSITKADVPGVVAEISAQNSHLDGHAPTYGIGKSVDSALFEIVGGNQLNMASIGTKSSYTANVTASGLSVFESGNNWKTVTITVMADTVPPAPVLSTDAVLPTDADSITVSVDFGEAINATTFIVSDVLVTGGGASNLAHQSGNRTFAFTLTPAAYGEVTASIPAGSVAYLAGNTNAASNTLQITFEASGPKPFVTTWKTASGGETITIPLVGSTGITVDWGDGDTTTVSGTATHTYADPGTHTVSISGNLTGINMLQHADAPKLLSIEQWGDTSWGSFKFAFWGTVNMVYNATDEPDLSGVNSTSRMFSRASSFNGNLSSWDVSSVTDMSYMFFGATSFDGDISGWNVSQVTDMNRMFENARAFNGNISRWNVSSVTDMTEMFHFAYSFNNLLNNWDVSSVTSMSGMFDGSNFNQPLDNWNVSSATSMNAMFYQAASFNLPLDNWDVSSVTSMSSMFDTASLFDQPLNNWNVSQVTNMGRMFTNADNFDQPLDNWNVSSVTNMDQMFRGTAAFNYPLNNWDVSKATSMNRMFNRAAAFDQNLGNWYVTLDDTTMPGDLSAAPTVSPLNTYIEGRSPLYTVNDTRFVMDGKTLRFNMTNLPTGGEYPLAITATAKLDEVNNPRHTRDVTITVMGDPARPFVTTWETDAANQRITIPVGSSFASYYIDWGDGTIESAVTGDQAHTYAGAGNHTIYISGGFERIALNSTASASKLVSIDQWGDTQWTSMESAFHGAGNMVYKATDVPDLSGVISMKEMFHGASSFDGDISGWNVSSVTDMSYMFSGARAFDQDLNDWNTSRVTNTSGMFNTATSFNQNLNGWNVSQVTTMARMFNGASVFNGNISSWNVSSVTEMTSMFDYASAFDQNLNGWNVSSVTTMARMFNEATSFDQNLDGWNVSSVTTMSRMFYYASAFDQNLNSWNVSSVTDMGSMFLRATSFNWDLNDWNTSRVTNMRGMFTQASAFNGNISGWNVSSVTNMERMFSGASSFEGNISGWNVSKVTSMSHMFSGASAFNGNISGWNVSSVRTMTGMFSGASSFNGNISGWNVSSVRTMTGMFDGVDSFNQNLGNWYITLNSASIEYSNVPGVVGKISAQNSFLGSQNPQYGIVAGGDRNFEITGENLLSMTSFNITETYTVNVTASGPNVFENDNNWRLLNITVTAVENARPTVKAGSDQTIPEGGTFTLSGATAADEDDGTVLTYSWSAPDGSGITIADPDALSPTITVSSVDSDTRVTLTLTVNDQSGTSSATATDTVVLTIKETSNHFVTTWQTGSAGESITIPGTGTYMVIWGDGRAPDNVSGTQTHTYAVEGNYTVSISGGLTGFDLSADSPENAQKLRSIEQWGSISWTSLESAFLGATNMVYMATDVPDLSKVTDMSRMFSGAYSFDGDFSGWDVSSVTDMSRMFFSAGTFNGNISGWDVSSVTDMSRMFSGAYSFDGDLSSWNVLSVTTMEHMFQDASSFDGNISGWNVSQVTDTSQMFSGAYSFDGDLSSWDVSSVTAMERMFQGALFNGNISGWNVSQVTDMFRMFSGTPFSGNISGWNVSQVTNMAYMFFGTPFNGNISGWDVSSVADMQSMFAAARSFDGNLSGWNVSSVTSMSNMFSDASSFNGNLSGWDVSSVRDMNSMFFGTPFNGNLSGWNVSQVTDMSQMFFGTAFNGDLSGWDVSSVRDMNRMFDNARYFHQNLGNWYITLNSTTIEHPDVPGVIGKISAQNRPLSAHSPSYDIVAGGNPIFEITGENLLNITSVVEKGTYTVNVTASGPNVFENGNNWRMVEVTVLPESNKSPRVDAGELQTINEGETVTISGNATDPNRNDTLTYSWSQGSPSAPLVSFANHSALSTTFVAPLVDDDTDFALILNVTDGTVSVTDQVIIRILDVPGFVTTWKTTSAGETITIPLIGNGISVDWGDGQTDENVSGRVTHAYADPGKHAVSVSGGLTGIRISWHTDASKLLSIDQWGGISWTSLELAFSGASNMVYNATDVPDLSQVANMHQMFSGTASFNGNLSGWDVSKVTDMKLMFFNAASFNGNLSSWDVSKVTNMGQMFEGATSFNGDLSGWSPSKVTNMGRMFEGATSFNGDLPDWNVSKVTNMGRMFKGATSFNGDISGWDVSKVTNLSYMFDDATSFNGDLPDWNVSKVAYMNYMFSGATSFNGNISSWDVSKVTNMSYMFSGARAFNGDLPDWNVSKVTNMNGMFFGATSFDGDLSGWSPSKVTNMRLMLASTHAFKGDISGWDISSVRDMTSMFYDTRAFNGDISGWDVSKVTLMDDMFSNTRAFNGDLSDWDVSSVTSMYRMFDYARSFNQNLGNWYITLNSTTIEHPDVPGVIGKISAQNRHLSGHSPSYNIVVVGDNSIFEIAGGNLLNITSVVEKGTYTVNVAASGSRVFENGNNWRTVEVTVLPESNKPPRVDAGEPQTINEGETVTIFGSAIDSNRDDTLTYSWSQDSPSAPLISFADHHALSTTFVAPLVDDDTDFALILNVTDGTVSVTDQVIIRILDVPGFVTTWKTTSAGETITIPLIGDGINVDWGDGQTDENVLGSIVPNQQDNHDHGRSANNDVLRYVTHTYANPGDYAVSISGGLTGIRIGGHADASKLYSIDQWGAISWTSLESAFWGASNMVYNAADVPDLSRVTDMNNMFASSSSFDGDLSGWDVSSVRTMTGMFASSSSFDGDLSGWNVSSVTDMSSMFLGATSFDGDLSGWNVSSVTDMGRMFSGATSFDQNISSWNVSSVTDMTSMFSGTASFDQNISSWNVSSVTDMTSMFSGATSFEGDLSGWNVSSVADMQSMFATAHSFNGNISGWNVSSVTSMSNMFSDALSFNGAISGWNVSSVTDMTSMFFGARDFDGDLSGWKVSGVTTMYKMFNDATSFDGDLSGWDVSGVGDMTDMFKGAASFRQNLGEWYIVLDDTTISDATETLAIRAKNGVLDDQNLTYGLGEGGDSGMFAMSGNSLGLNLAVDYSVKSAYSVNITSTGTFGAGNHRMVDITVDEIRNPTGDFVTTWRTSAADQTLTIPIHTIPTYDYTVIWGDGSNSTGVTGNAVHTYADAGEHQVRIYGTYPRVYLNDHADAPNLVSINQWGFNQWTSMHGAFRGASTMTYNATDAPGLSGVTDMSNMFHGATSFDGDISRWDVSGVTDMANMFDTATSFDRPLNDWNVSSVTYMTLMFANAESFNQDISRWDVLGVTNMARMFSGATSFNQTLNDWDVSGVTNTASMFSGATSFDRPLNDWNVSRVTDTSYMFSGTTSFDRPLNDWDVSKVTNMARMFSGATSFNQDISGWDVLKVTNMGEMFDGAASFEQNLGEWYIVPADTAYDVATNTLNVTMISAQNSALNGHSPDYAIGAGGNFTLFNMTGSTLMFKTTPSAGGYTVNVTAPGGDFGTGNHRILEVTATGRVNTLPSVSAGSDLIVAEGSTLALSGSATDTDGDAITSYAWSAPPGSGITFANTSLPTTTFTAPAVTSETTFTLRLTASDGTDDGTDTIDVTVKDTSGAFITTWRTTSGGQSITIPVGGATGTYDVIWGDGTAFTGLTGDQTHTYAASGDHTVAILGGFERIHLNGHADASKLRSIDQWGDTQWTSMKSAFNGTGNMMMMMYKATDAPDLSGVQDMSGMFEDSSFNGDISGWNVSQVTDMSSTFYGAASFNQSLNSWDVSQVTDMSRMFNNAYDFNGNISGWNVSQVTDMSRMFFQAYDFNGNISGWNVSKVINMDRMFFQADTFNQHLDDWDVSQVTDMSSMFYGTLAFNGNISSWNVSQVTDTSYMFSNARTFNGNISGWNVSAVTNMADMFEDADSFNWSLNDWNVSSVISMAGMFANTDVFDQDISGWDVSEVTNMSYMFHQTTFNGNISGWNVSKVTDMNSMFANTDAFNQDISGWDVSAVTDMREMFNGAASFEQNLGEWYVVLDDTTISGAAETLAIRAKNGALDGQTLTYSLGQDGDSGLFVISGRTLGLNSTVDYSGKTQYSVNIMSTGGFGTGNHRMVDVTVAEMRDSAGDFVTTWRTSSANQTVTIPVHSGSTYDYTIIWGDGTNSTGVTGNAVHKYADAGDHQVKIYGAYPRIHLNVHADASKLVSIDQWGDTQWTSMENAFRGASNMVYKATDAPDLSGVQDMSGMFENSSFNGNISGWNVSQVTDMSNMFYGAASFDQRLNDWNVSQVTDMSSMFFYATSFNQHLNDWNVSSVTIMNGMFRGALTFNGNVSSWNVSQVTDTSYMFSAARAFNGNVSSWNVSQVTSMLRMFLGASDFNGDISGWNVSQVTDMLGMFSGATSFDRPLNGWNVSQVTDMSNMFHNATSFDRPLNGWNVSSVIHMDHMFHNATSFDRPLNGWNVSKVTNMNSMFANTDDFNGDISGWNVSQVTHMSSMFESADDFNGDISGWNVSSVTYMSSMFESADDFNGDISGWNVLSVTNMGRMFASASTFNQDLDIWNTSRVTDMFGMFASASNFNGTISSWDVSSVLSMSQMFDGADSFEQNLGEWYIVPADIAYDATANTLNVTTISAQNPALTGHDPDYDIGTGDNFDLFNMTGNTLMFKATPSAGGYTVNVTAPGGNFGTGNHRVLDITVTGITNAPPTVMAGSDLTVAEGDTLALSGSATDTNGDAITSYTWSAMPDLGITFANASLPTTTFTAPSVDADATYTLTLTASDGTDDGDDTINVTVKETSGAFITTWRTTTANESITIPVHTATGRYDVIWGDGTISENVRGDKTHPYATSGNHTVTILGGFEMLRLDGLSRTNASKLMSVDQWGAIGWTSMESAFYRASNMEYRATDSPDLSRVRTMIHMFDGAKKFNGNISDWNVSSVTNMNQVFAGASVFDQDLNSWNVSSITSMSEMFYSARAFNQDLNSWNTSRVTTMSGMFTGASAFNGDISDWNISQVTDMSGMFRDASAFNGNISGWDVSSVRNTAFMFSGASAFNDNISGWDVSSVNNMANMFNGANSFNQNLGNWYVVANATSIARADVPGVVAEISAQNSELDGHTPTYDIGDGIDKDLFEIVGGNQLNMTSADTKSSYTVNVTASDGSVFENDNNWHVLEITVTGSANMPPTVNAGTNQTVGEGDTVTLSGTATDPEGDAVSYMWSAMPARITFANASSASTTFTAPAVTALILRTPSGSLSATGLTMGPIR